MATLSVLNRGARSLRHAYDEGYIRYREAYAALAPLFHRVETAARGPAWRWDVDASAVETFKRRLSEVIAWCMPRVSIADPEHCLRTPALRPPDLLQASRLVTNQLNERLARELPQAPGEPLPKLAERRAQEFARLYRAQMPRIQAEQQAAVDALAEQRARLLQLANAYPDADERDVLVRGLSGGRLLVCTGLDESVWDGAAQAESRGVFGINDLAPWDTWIC